MPLMVGGQVAGSQTCCCENPPPPLCYCPGNCSYYVEVVTPAAVAVKSPAGTCPEIFPPPSNYKTAAVEWIFDGVEYLPGWDVCDAPYVAPSLIADALASTESTVVSGAYLCHPDHPGDYIEVIVRARVGPIYCNFGGAFLGVPVFVAFVDVFARRASTGSARLLAGSTVYPPTFCQYNAKRSCGAPSQTPMPPNGFLYIQTPMTVVVERANATANGIETAFTEAIWSGTGGADQDLIAFVEALADAASFTFRITSRPNCDSPVTCNCDASLRGMNVTLGNLKSITNSTPLSWGVDSSQVDFVRLRSDQIISWQGPFGFYEYEQSDPDGPRDGDGNCTRRLWYQRAELYCDVIDGVAQWFVLFTSFRDIYDEAGTSTHRSYDQWAGKIDCFKACEDLDNYIDADESVPMGEPYEIEYLGRTTVTGYLECEPPPRLTIRLTQIVTC